MAGGGGGRLCGRTHIQLINFNSTLFHFSITSAKREVPYGRLQGALRVYNALSCYLSLKFKHFNTKQNIVDQILGGAPAAPTLNPPLV